jgi:hypothetical protein
LSTFAVENSLAPTHIGLGEWIPASKELKMRILEMAVAGILAVGAQMLVVGAVLI